MPRVPVVETLARCDGSRFLMFETLAERTLALAQLERRADPSRGYNPALERFVGPILKRCLAEGIRIVGNFGAANPRAAAARIASLAREQGIKPPRIAVIEGDDLSSLLSPGELAARETGGTLLAGKPSIISANLYLGAYAIAEALDRGAEIVVTGRVANSALALARSSTCSNGSVRIGTAWPPGRSRVICSNAEPRSPAGTSPIRV